MTSILFIPASAALMFGIAFLLVRRFTARVVSAEALSQADRAPLQHLRRMERLLSSADFEFARAHGLSQERLRRLRADRRRIYRLYLRDLIAEFNAVAQTLRLLLVTSAGDRPDLAGELSRQRFAFYRALAITQVQLALHACGFDQSLSLDMVNVVEGLRASLQQFVEMPSAC